jgi:hypothetical protein
VGNEADSRNAPGRASTIDAVGSRLAGRSPVADGIALGAVMVVVLSYLNGFLSAAPGYVGHDLVLYQHEVKAWLGGTPMYPAFEVQGPFQIVEGVILYPPITIALFLPTLWLPLPLWWLIPIAIVGTIAYRLRPRRRWLLAIACCLAYPVSVGLVVSGNPDLWLAAALAIAVYWHPAGAFVLLKPSVFPFAMIGWRRREWWVIAGAFAVASLFLLPQTIDWLSVIRNGRGGLRSGLVYSYQDVPLLLVPILAWAGSNRAASLGPAFGVSPAWLRRRLRWGHRAESPSQ